MDLPWYRTPFLFHKRLIRDVETIGVMKQHGANTSPLIRLRDWTCRRRTHAARPIEALQTHWTLEG